ncbi:maleylpyruvate isomerase family mycothiol-dependent enzyme [Nocardioides coralli]|uniref:maleylpyruvate isomerase family mycothiol-dependent enzyme n=1 Tax=Nocardioides coralli TaxID=2872154 RepID=UPI001CA3E42E|nr:maleylpyruvate isomerase family mycothiol-dependent enzyme [Nocardioides coralli]QZY28944.1 maleylpyruvate isomerase family mycothiol-dependent enzyme [Nocardioides coralli]
MAHPLPPLVALWWRAIDDYTTLLEQLSPEDWRRPTDLAGWDVFCVAAHVAHLEAMQAGNPHEETEIGEPPHVRGLMGTFTEQGVVARRDRTPDELITETRSCATTRHTQLLAEAPTDGTVAAPGVFGLIGWNLEQLLRNRPLDVWMHEQDIRRATDRRGNLESPAAVHTADYLAESLGFVLAKRVGAPAGTTVVLEVAGHPAYAAEVGEDGRGRMLPESPDQPRARLATSRETFVLLAGGRRPELADTVSISGDEELGRAIVANLAVTP